jgi:hypothetical protein
MSNAVLAAASIEERWLLNISRAALGFFGCEGSILANVSALTCTPDGLEGPYLYRFDEHPKILSPADDSQTRHLFLSQQGASV